MIDEVKQLASQGYSKREVCRRLGLSRYALYKLLEGHEVKWKPVGQTNSCQARAERNRSREVRDRLALNAVQRGVAELYDVGDGRMLTRGQIARETGARLQTIAWRVRHGHRGADLLRPADSRRGGKPRKHVYVTGLTVADWEQVLEYARQRSPRIAAETFEVPLGAVKAMLKGEDWRVE
jgi:transposase-like protein